MVTEDIEEYLKVEEDFKYISDKINEYGEGSIELDNFINTLFNEDIKTSVDAVNAFCIDKEVYLKQNQFDAVVMLHYNCNLEIESSDLGRELLAHTGQKDPQFVKKNIVEGFTYTKQGGVRIDGLVTRRNNEINLFLKGDYTYYDSKKEVIPNGIDEIAYP